MLIEEINIDTAFKVAWAGFLHMGKFTYTNSEAWSSTFINTKLIRSDITFASNNQHAIFCLKWSKTDLENLGVEIVLATTHNKTCPVFALQSLFKQDSQPHTALFFRLTGKFTAFERKPVLDILQQRLQHHNVITAKLYTGHSFRKGAVQHASNMGMLDKHIQKLGCWISRAFQLYFETSVFSLYALNMHFQTGQAKSLNR